MNDAEIFTDDVPPATAEDRSGSLDGLGPIVNCPGDGRLFHGPEEVRNAHARKTGIPPELLRSMRGNIRTILSDTPTTVSRA